MQDSTISLHELCELFRANRISVSERNIGKMIAEGKFPFAVGTYSDNDKLVALIFRSGVRLWLAKMMQVDESKVKGF